MNFRIKCPKCGEVLNIAGDQACPKCKESLTTEGKGEIQLYRMGSPLAVAAGYGIYMNDQPMGHIGNKESLRILLPYGTYTVRFTCGLTRKCQAATVTLSEEAPVAYVKGSIKAGFWSNTLIATVVTKEDMPTE